MVENTHPDQDRKTRVFISYSRKDSAFADRLRDGLTARGFEAYLDKHDIRPGEPWQERIGGLITRADMVIFCLSPNFVASKICDWEVNEAERFGKRLLPVVVADPDPDKTPGRLKRLNYIFMLAGDDFVDGLGQIESAINTDIIWIREHTRLTERTAQWLKVERSERAMLRGEDIAAAENWITRRPREAPDITQEVGQFIAGSRKAETARERRARIRGRIITSASLVAAAIMGVLGWQMYVERQAAITEKLRAEESERRAKTEAKLARKEELDARVQDYRASLFRLRPPTGDTAAQGIVLQRNYFTAGNRLGFTFFRRADSEENSDEKKSELKNALTTFDYVQKQYDTYPPEADPDPSIMLEKLITAIGLSEALARNTDDREFKATHKKTLWNAVVALYDFVPPTKAKNRWKDNIFRGFLYASKHSFDAQNYAEALERANPIVEVMTKPPYGGAQDHRYAARAYGKLAWNALFARKFNASLTAAQKARDIVKNNGLERLWKIEINYPHALLFNGRNAEAKKYYQKYKPVEIREEFKKLIKGNLCHAYILKRLEKAGRCVGGKLSAASSWFW